jgi:hypothetical protein
MINIVLQNSWVRIRHCSRSIAFVLVALLFTSCDVDLSIMKLHKAKTHLIKVSSSLPYYHQTHTKHFNILTISTIPHRRSRPYQTYRAFQSFSEPHLHQRICHFQLKHSISRPCSRQFLLKTTCSVVSIAKTITIPKRK